MFEDASQIPIPVHDHTAGNIAEYLLVALP